MRILGRGKTAKAIQERYPEAVMYDDSEISKYNVSSNELTVVSPGIPPHNILVHNTKNLVSEYDLFYKEMPFTIWISGTNGKTTTTQMLQHLLSEYNSQCGGNIGFPLAKMDKTKDIWILETSSFTLHYTNIAKPNIYILLPISDDHLSWHGTFEEYRDSKLKPLSLMNKEDIAIVPAQYKYYKTDAQTIYYENTADLEREFSIESKKVYFKEPFLLDAVVTMAVAQIISKRLHYTKINTFIQDPHKLEEFQDEYNRVWIDDSKATNIDATIQALKTYANKTIYLILGGDDKGANLLPLFEELQKYDVTLYLIGKNSALLKELSLKYTINAFKVDILEKAVETINHTYKASKGSVCLLSPAAASLDQFSSYKERGEKFKELINSFTS